MAPFVTIHFIKAAPPALTDNGADLDRLRRSLAPLLGGKQIFIPWRRMARVALAFRRAGFEGAAIVADLARGPELLDFLPVVPGSLAGLALDLGTTILEARLLDLVTGATLAQGHLENPQMACGDDILSRIIMAGEESGLRRLHGLLVAAVNELIGRLAREAGIGRQEIWAIAASGNTAMTHFFLALDPRNLCREPYIPQAQVIDPCAAEELGLDIHPAAPVWTTPGVGSYFGGDLVAGIVATGLDQREEVCLLVDVGTNAEVVVGNRDWLMACAGAAGPALEGGVADMGMRAGPGAVDRVSIDGATGAVSYSTIGKGPARGLCGSGIIDLVAALYLNRIIDFRGKLRPGGHPGVVEQQGGLAFVVVPGECSASARPVLFSQLDLDAVIRSKAAMYAILTTLLNQVGLTFPELHAIYVAGAFGGHIAPRQAITIGMLPDLDLEKYIPIGNSALAGSAQILLSRSARDRCLEVIKRITYLELNVNHEFMIRFSGCRVIPHTDAVAFPTVPFYMD